MVYTAVEETFFPAGREEEGEGEGEENRAVENIRKKTENKPALGRPLADYAEDPIERGCSTAT